MFMVKDLGPTALPEQPVAPKEKQVKTNE